MESSFDWSVKTENYD